MTPRYAIFSALDLGDLLELEQSGTVLTANAPADINRTVRALYPQAVGRWYAELLVYGSDDLRASIGVVTAAANLATYAGGDANGYGYRLGGGEIHHGGGSVATVPAAAKGDLIGLLLDMTLTQPTVTWWRNGALVATQPLPSVGPWYLAVSLATSSAYGLRVWLNSGQRAFEYPQGPDGWYEPPAELQGLRLASEDWLSDPADAVPNARYQGLLSADTGEARAMRSLDFWPWQRGIKSGAMTLTVLDPDNQFAELLAGDSRDLPVVLSAVQRGQAYAARTPLYKAIIDSVSAVDDLQVKLTCRDPLGLLDVPVQRQLIRPDADVSAANQPWPLMLGACRNVPAVLIDATAYVYAVSDLPVMGIGYCRDKGYPMDPAAAPADFTLSADRRRLQLHSAPQGNVTVDVSSVGGDQLPQPSDDVLGGAGNPFTGTDGSTPDGFDDVGGAVPQATPRLNGGVLEFPLVQVAPTIHATMPIYTNGLVGQAALRISWIADDGSEVGTSEAPRISGSNDWAVYQVTDTAPAMATRARIEAVAFNHTAGVIRVGEPTAEYVIYGDHDTIGLVNGSFEDGSNGWTASSLGWDYTGKGANSTGNSAKYSGSGVSSLTNDGVAPVTPGQRITATGMISLDKPNNSHPAGQVVIRWLDANDNAIGQAASPVETTGHQGKFRLVTVTGTAPAGAAYAQLVLGANNDAHNGSGPLFDEIRWDFVLDAAGGDRVAIILKGLDDASGWQLEAGWSLQPAGANGYQGGAYAEHAPVGTAALRSTVTSNVRQAVAYASWAGISAAKLGSGQSYKVTITITAMPDDGQSYVGLAYGKTLDTMLAKWTAPGTYTVTITNTSGGDYDLYLLSIPLGGAGAVPTPPAIGSVQVIHYDDTFNPDPRATTPANLQAITLADCLHQLLDVHAPQQGLAWSREDAAAIDAVTGYAGVGLYLQAGETIRAALDLVVASYTACYWADAAGTLRLTRLVAPESVPAGQRAGTIDINAMSGDLVPVLDTAPGLTTQMGVRRNWATLADGDLVEASTNFPLAVRQGMLRAYQLNVSTAQQLAGSYRHALYAAPAASCFDRQADGQAEIDRVGAIYTVARWFYQVTLELEALPSIDLGQIWTLVYPRYGLASGKPVMVIDFEPDLLANTANVILWG